LQQLRAINMTARGSEQSIYVGAIRRNVCHIRQ
jgi:hypothetical protein